MTTQHKNFIFKATLGEVVKAWREEHGWSITELAKRSGYSKGYISGLEKNKTHQPNEEHQIGLARALEIPFEYLILRRLPSDLSPDERKEVEEAWRTSTTNSTSKEAGKSKRGGFGFSAPGILPEAHLKEEEALRHLLVFADVLQDEEVQLQQRLIHVKELQTIVEKLITERGG